MAYCTEADIEAMIGFAIDATSRPTTTQLAVMLTNADSIINAFIRESSNITDTYGILQTIACHLVIKMVNNLFAFAEPENYPLLEIGLTEQDEKLVLKAHSKWQVKSWEMGVD